jgi:hypothetical protein
MLDSEKGREVVVCKNKKKVMATVGDLRPPSTLAASCYFCKNTLAAIGNDGQGVFFFQKSHLPLFSMKLLLSYGQSEV